MSKNIPTEIANKVSEYANRLGLSVDVLMDKLANFYNEEKDRHPKTAWTIAIRRLRGELKREGRMYWSSAMPYEGIFFGSTRLIDWIEVAKQKALAMYANPETRKKAIDEHYVTPDGIPLDRREQVNFKENPNYLQPFKDGEHDWYRVLYGLVSPLHKNEYKFCKFRFRGNIAQSLEFSFLTEYVFRATGGLTDDGIYNLNATKATKLDLLSEAHSSNFWDEIIYKCGMNIYGLQDLETLYEMYGTDRENPVLIEAQVPHIETEVNVKTQNRLIILDDERMPLNYTGTRCFVSGIFPLTFKEDSTVVVLGYLSKMEDREGKEQIIINAYGLCPISKYLRS